MLWFNAGKGLGSIGTADDERMPVTEGDFLPGEAPAGRCSGRRVTFDVVVRDGESHAVNVRFPVELDPPRARLRRGHRAR
jgi:cold shock CspA family protein